MDLRAHSLFTAADHKSDSTKKLMPAAYDSSLDELDAVMVHVPPASPQPSVHTTATTNLTLATKPKGLILLDWDGTIVTIPANQKKSPDFIDAARTSEILLEALARGIDIHIVTAKPLESAPGFLDSNVDLLKRLKDLGLLNSTYNETFWRARIHCVVKDIPELEAFNKNPLRHIEIAKRKKTCVEQILRNPPYLGLNYVRFYDDNLYNCGAISTIREVIAVQAKADGSHFDDLHDFVNRIQRPIQPPLARSASPELATVPLNTNERQFFEELERCLNAMYPDRPQWKGKAKTNAGGVKELHRLIINKNGTLEFADIHAVHDIAKKRLDKGCSACCPTFFGGRAPEVQRLYSILGKLGGHEGRTIIPLQNLSQARSMLAEFANELLAQKRAPAQTEMPTVR